MSDEVFESLDDAAVVALQARALPHLRAVDILTSDGSNPAAAAELMAKADLYCNAFVAMTDKCICCGWSLGGFMGSFVWGLAHGEGYCGRCSYPARAIHRIDGVGMLSGLILQYHPSQLSLSSAPAEVSP